MRKRLLGTSGIEVSVLSLGSWRTYERVPRPQALATMAAAREAGIAFLDDARYGAGGAGHSEVLFGELFHETGWRRDEVVIANKLWWEFWPAQSAMQELEGSLGRMGLDHLDLEYSAPPPAGLAVEEIVQANAGLIASGKLRAWGGAELARGADRGSGAHCARRRTPGAVCGATASWIAARSTTPRWRPRSPRRGRASSPRRASRSVR